MPVTVTADNGRTYTLRARGRCLDCGLPIYDDPGTCSTALCPCWDEPPRDLLLSLRPNRRDVGRVVALITLYHPVRTGTLIGWGSPCDEQPALVRLDGATFRRAVTARPEDLILMGEPS